MIVVISPAKTLDFQSKPVTKSFTLPDHLIKSDFVIKKLRTLSQKKVSELMSLSQNLSELNVQRYRDWNPDFNVENAKQSILAFMGDVYLGLQAQTFKEKDFDFAQKHLLILSGLHGYLHPLDLIMPYRLEMGTNIKIGKAKNLYDYWTEDVTNYINQFSEGQKEKSLINLASEEYFKVINKKNLSIPLLNIEFKEKKGDDFKTIGFFAKKARGFMASYIIKNKIEKSKDLKGFDKEGYSFNARLSNSTNWTFTRNQS